MAISKIIHQTGPAPLPAAYKGEWQQSWKDAHPAWTYTLHTDADLLALAQAKYPTFAPVFADPNTPGVVKGDFGRLLVLYDQGGVYADLDHCCLKPLDALLAGKTLVLSEMSRSQPLSCAQPWAKFIHNAFVAAPAGHPLVKMTLDAALAIWTDGQQKSPECIAGPRTLMDQFRLYDGDDVYVSPPSELCPVSYMAGANPGLTATRDELTDDTLDQLRQQFPDAYAVTFWLHQW